MGCPCDILLDALCHGAEAAAGYDGDLDAAIQHLFQKPEFLAPGKNAPGLFRVLTQMANHPNPLPPPGKTQPRRGEPSAIQSIGGAQEPQQHSRRSRILHPPERGIVVRFGNLPAMAQGKIGQGAALALFERKLEITADDAGADGRMILVVHRSPDVMQIRRQLQHAKVAPRQIVQRQCDVE